ncbi:MULTISPECIES: outer membrane lipoprotein chaperone LolA [unclassified Acinetobacter]|uniref:outer membrane lipoprotein chaperone LolA n=1 Tax=unclassified Acinetobacter TaxID=196816 RepID=UPI00244A21E7|nr:MULTISPECIES: outer membrane lipoprotein chaperone LolA [unclassified Acinetobacter]MDH0030706.1 outer membrane lipoprotein chaperone LolA [Acinetobacter sp. GD04021]MDH0886184.1 outer membrane lipoprotein chaperone LolA [Acinetobacter sp. GD03873]MDH1081842.1 outer membrane lipoprotein chaperone LolA [Acinetobacter sp. GD03983]MDH2189661.1 outer membrane lipoprotein chaperone LolA [Acinetobacter sp. GD03645]MDH2202653.1 outer membrane lipoprotein chaperone LolA [Acinetobacter sp. GD03647]
MNFVKKIAYAATLSAITLAPVVGSQVFAAPVAASAQQATSSLVQQLAGLQRLTADFEQSTKTTNNKTVQKKGLTAQHMNQTFKGVMKVERPGKFYWETTSPAKQTIVTTGKVVWIYDPDLQQAVRQSLDDQVANTPALLLSGNTNQIMDAYRVTQPDRTKLYYTLYPKQDDGAFQSLTISFGANKAPNLMVLQDSLGQTTYVRFSNIKVNPAIPASVFNFEPPKGTDIIDQ